MRAEVDEADREADEADAETDDPRIEEHAQEVLDYATGLVYEHDLDDKAEEGFPRDADLW